MKNLGCSAKDQQETCLITNNEVQHMGSALSIQYCTAVLSTESAMPLAKNEIGQHKRYRCCCLVSD